MLLMTFLNFLDNYENKLSGQINHFDKKHCRQILTGTNKLKNTYSINY